MKQVHGHEVMNMMLNSGKSYTRQSLVADIIQEFGAETRFHTCSAEDMTAEQLVEFLDARGKLVHFGTSFTTSPDRMCKH